MKDNRTFKLLWGAILVLLVLNIGMIAWVTFSPQKGRPPERLFLEHELSFDRHQTDLYKEMREEHFSKARSLKESVKELKEAYFNDLADTNITDEELTKKAITMETKMAELDVLTFKHFQKVRQMCTPEQQKKFDTIIMHVLRSMDRPGPPPRGEHPPEMEHRPPPDR